MVLSWHYLELKILKTCTGIYHDNNTHNEHQNTCLDLSENLNTLPDCWSQFLENIRVLPSKVLKFILHNKK